MEHHLLKEISRIRRQKCRDSRTPERVTLDREDNSKRKRISRNTQILYGDLIDESVVNVEIIPREEIVSTSQVER